MYISLPLKKLKQTLYLGDACICKEFKFFKNVGTLAFYLTCPKCYFYFEDLLYYYVK